MNLSLQNISTETQAPSRLAVLCSEVMGGVQLSQQWHRAYGPSLSTQVPDFSAIRCSRDTHTRGGRMLALPLFAGVDPGANAKQEGIP